MEEQFDFDLFLERDKSSTIQRQYPIIPYSPTSHPLQSENFIDIEHEHLDQIKNQEKQPEKYFKAYNPMDLIDRLPQQKRQQYIKWANSAKRFNGIQLFFGLEGGDPNYSEQFLKGIDEKAFQNQKMNDIGLEKLFADQSLVTEKQTFQNTISHLKQKISQIQNKNFSSISFNKTIAHSFYQHFDNFSLAYNPSNFIQELEPALVNFIQSAKKMKGPGMELILGIYDFWMKTFKDFVNEVWKYSEKYTLNLFKKEKTTQLSDQSSEMKSQLSKEKRKNWSNDQLNFLQRIIDSNVIFSQNKLKQLSEQLGRSVNSISSKIQKILKSKKGEQYQQDSLLSKTIQILKLQPKGLNKQTIIERINEYYEMGFDGQWQKSVGQLLSSRKQFLRMKGRYKLLNGQTYYFRKEEDYSKLTFKDKVVKCFLQYPNFQADLRSLVQSYIALYGDIQYMQGDSDQRRKSIQSSISKTLSRYEIFDCTNSKTIYVYSQSQGDSPKQKKQEDKFQLDIDGYMAL